VTATNVNAKRLKTLIQHVRQYVSVQQSHNSIVFAECAVFS